MSQIVFTRLDPLLSELEANDLAFIKTTISKLRSRNIPLVLVTDKTRVEVEAWQQQFELHSPFIVEQGSGIFIPQANRNFNPSATIAIDNYYLYQLGCSYTEARAALKAVQEEINKILRGFGDMDEKNIQPLIGSSQSAARKAKAREFSEYFITPNRLEIKELQHVATEYNFKIVPGDRLSLILGAGADEIAAIKWLIECFTGEDIRTIGLGSIVDDLNLLETVDIPIVIPTFEGIPSYFSDRNWQTTSNSGIEGWAEALSNI